MRKYILIILIAVSVGLSSCGEDFLTAMPTERQQAGGPATEGAILSNLASAYQILLLDSYANSNYNSILLMSDLRSDDIYKGGGDAGDQHQLYLLSMFASTPQENISGLWSIYFSGLTRCNNVLIACENAVDVDEDKLNQYKAEAYFLRAYYVHWLWKFWGNIPYFEAPLSDPPYMTRQFTADEIYAEIIKNIELAATPGHLPMRLPKDNSNNYITANIARVNRAAVLMLKARVVLYQKDTQRYAEVTRDMAEIINSGEFTLFPDFADIWIDENEFCNESIFEANHIPEGKDWDNAWGGYGTNLPEFISPSGLSAGNNPGDFKDGWGFGPVRAAAWDMYEEGDTRREGSINNWQPDQYTPRFQDTGYFMAKYSSRRGYNPQGTTALNYANNVRIFRYAETLLNYAELLTIHGQSPVGGVTAQAALDQIRGRAFGAANSIPATADNIKAERRKEFVGEGMRFWDIVRWGDTHLLTENTPLSTRTWQDYCKLLPIPQSEIERTTGTEFALQQNPGYN
ncbi:MAG: RagB/SusD family nutrient uptake outer membrane protein [Bacteroidia bacterium]|nr:RagB/SusD family nutrient uptake outer membrane protein [Bacteroidia bacterium]